MANTSTLVQRIPCSFGPAGFSQVYQYTVAFDTLTSDLTIHTPATGNRAAVVGLYYADTTAHNLIWKSASTTLVTIEKPVNSGESKGLGLDGALVVTKVSEALIAQVTTGLVSSLLVYVAEIGPEGLQFQSP